MEQENQKKIDDAWKDQVDKEKEALKKPEAPQQPADEFIPEQVDFTFFISTLAMQGAIFLGDIPNPVTNKQDVNLKEAKLIIDTLDVLKDKTHGNLSKEEEDLLSEILYGLQMRYVARQNDGGKNDRQRTS